MILWHDQGRKRQKSWGLEEEEGARQGNGWESSRIESVTSAEDGERHRIGQRTVQDWAHHQERENFLLYLLPPPAKPGSQGMPFPFLSTEFSVKRIGNICLFSAAFQLKNKKTKKNQQLQIKESFPIPNFTTHRSAIERKNQPYE